MTCPVDPALAVTNAAIAALLEVFDNQVCPPLIGTTSTIRFFAGDDDAALASWDSHASENCSTPFVWVRAMRRHGTAAFPAITVNGSPCAMPRVLPVELGVAWCTYVPEDDHVDPARYAADAVKSMDASWRIEVALCTASRILDEDDMGRQIGTDAVVPYGPAGGVASWTGVLYATY